MSTPLCDVADRLVDAEIRRAEIDLGNLTGDGDMIIASWRTGQSEVLLRIGTKGEYAVRLSTDLWSTDLAETLLDVVMLAREVAHEAGRPTPTRSAEEEVASFRRRVVAAAEAVRAMEQSDPNEENECLLDKTGASS
jgi:hypothetical protein